MASQEILKEFEELKKAGKINSEIDAYIEGKIKAIEEETDKTVEKIKKLLKGE